MKCILVGSQSTPWLETWWHHSPEERGWAGRWSRGTLLLGTRHARGGGTAALFYPQDFNRGSPGTRCLAGRWHSPIQLPVPAPRLPALLADPLHCHPLCLPFQSSYWGMKPPEAKGACHPSWPHTPPCCHPVLHPETSI